jgi:hypothetical protein
VILGLELRAFTLSHSASSFCDGYFQDRVLRTICLVWLWATILLISASWVPKITGMSHQRPVTSLFISHLDSAYRLPIWPVHVTCYFL